MTSPPPTITSLREQWSELYKTTLPSLAVSKDASQSKWPIHLDHCFARIILDNAIGVSKPWTEVLAAPAVKTMSAKQLSSAIELGEKIACGEVNLVELDERSLEIRGKASKAKNNKVGAKRKNLENSDDHGAEVKGDGDAQKKKKNKQIDGSISKYFLPPTPKDRRPSITTQQPVETIPSPDSKTSKPQDLHDGQDPTNTIAPPKQIAHFSSTRDPLDLIASSKTLTPYRKKVLSLLCKVPRGQWTSYAAISDHISSCSINKTCARAVGNAMRNNPFAPAVPCHRVLAADGQIGGFGGSWGEQGVHAREKRELLGEEGVMFDGKGRAKGVAWRGWEG